MALLKSRVLSTMARRGFFLDNSAAMGPQGEPAGGESQATLDEFNLKCEDQFGKDEGEGKKYMAEKVDCDDRICEIKSWKNVKNSSN